MEPPEPHPIRLVVADDGRRSRLTVFFRLLLTLPHLLWLLLWSLLTFLVAVVSWAAGLATGRVPDPLHRFLTRYVRYVTHVRAYLCLAANPFPGFLGRPGYPIDLEIGPPRPQHRASIGFRLLLAVPALLLAGALAGGGFGGRFASGWSVGGGVLATAAFLGWFAALARARTPQGFRDASAYALRYAAQTDCYVLLLTARYPDTAPGPPPNPDPRAAHPARLAVDDDLRRSRLTVLFRVLLFLPHLVWFLLWTVAAFLAAFVAWLAAVVRGTVPVALHRFLAAYVRYGVHLGAFFYLVANPFPGFTGRAGSYPVDVELPPAGRQPRATVGFRAFLAIPALFLNGALGGLLLVAAVLGWFAALALGRMPRGLREAGRYALAYAAQASAYLFLLTARYPFSSPWVGYAPPPEPAA
jgi:Domain of unknown function (DUF4389)